MRTPDVARLLIIGLILVALTAPSTAQAASHHGDGKGQYTETEGTVIRVHIYENGTAKWTLAVFTPLHGEDETDEFERFQRRFRQNKSTYTDHFRSQMTRAVEKADNNTERNMSASEFNSSTSLTTANLDVTGVVTYEFYWQGFARQTDYGLSVDGVFTGQYSLDTDEKLVLIGPENTTAKAAVPEPRPTISDRVVTYNGPRDFGETEPTVQFVYSSQTTDNETALQPLIRLGAVATAILGGIAAVAAAYLLLFTGDD